MNVAERTAVRASQVVPEPSPTGDAPAAPPASPAKSKLKPLAALVPYIWRYRGRAVAAVCALVAAALATLRCRSRYGAWSTSGSPAKAPTSSTATSR